MKPFWVETNKENNNYLIYFYNDLVNYINNKSVIITDYRDDNVFGFFCNLINAAVNNIDLVLYELESSDRIDLTPTGDDDKTEKVDTVYFKNKLNLEEIITKVVNSSSRLTFFTSGTTGVPKKVIHPLKNILRELRIGAKYSNDCWGFGYNPTHIAGIQLFFQGLVNQNLMINFFGRGRNSINYFLEVFKVTNISATPSFFRMLMPFEKEFRNIKRITLGGEKSTSDLINKIQIFFPEAKVNNVYASTEFGSLFSSSKDFFKIRDSYSNLVRISEGRILVHLDLLGDNMHENLIDKEWYDTGDMVEFVDEFQIHFRIIGRANEIINVGGEKVNPIDVESKLLLFDEIKECRVYGFENSVLGRIVAVDIVLYENCNITAVEIRKRLNGELHDFKIPRKINFIENLERSRTGKISRNI